MPFLDTIIMASFALIDTNSLLITYSKQNDLHPMTHRCAISVYSLVIVETDRLAFSS
jgi:hypothetical protein